MSAKPLRFEQVYAAPEDARRIREIIKKKYALATADIRDTVQRTVTEDYLNGFASELALPTVMFPEDKTDGTTFTNGVRYVQ